MRESACESEQQVSITGRKKEQRTWESWNVKAPMIESASGSEQQVSVSERRKEQGAVLRRPYRPFFNAKNLITEALLPLCDVSSPVLNRRSPFERSVCGSGSFAVFRPHPKARPGAWRMSNAQLGPACARVTSVLPCFSVVVVVVGAT